MLPSPTSSVPRSSFAGLRLVTALSLALALLMARGMAASQAPKTGGDTLHRPLDQILDVYVRDGLVYYRALQSERRKLDDYIRSLDSSDVAARIASWPRDQQLAFWLNAYNAFVMQTVIDHYPIHGRSSQYPENSVRQIPGAFDRSPHRAAGRSVTLDEIEKEVLPGFRDPRVYLALGRGAMGSGRLRSEAYHAGQLETELQEATRETATELSSFEIDRGAKQIRVTSVIGWRSAEFVAAYGNAASRYANRSPIERAILALVEPFLFASEIEFLEKDEFTIIYRDFDWRLNDLTGMHE